MTLKRIVEFEFDLEQRVITYFGDEGIIETLAFDGGGNNYLVKTQRDRSWWKEKDLTPKELTSKDDCED